MSYWEALLPTVSTGCKKPSQWETLECVRCVLARGALKGNLVDTRVPQSARFRASSIFVAEHCKYLFGNRLGVLSFDRKLKRYTLT